MSARAVGGATVPSSGRETTFAPLRACHGGLPRLGLPRAPCSVRLSGLTLRCSGLDRNAPALLAGLLSLGEMDPEDLADVHAGHPLQNGRLLSARRRRAARAGLASGELPEQPVQVFLDPPHELPWGSAEEHGWAQQATRVPRS